MRTIGQLALLAIVCMDLRALDRGKAITQYTRTVWRQEQGLPQDTVRAISQTHDGFLWLGTNEGLVRFDGYDFVRFTKGDGSLPGNTVGKLLADKKGNLWIGTFDGLARYSNGAFKVFSGRDGLPPGSVSALTEDRTGAIWLVAGGMVSRYENGKFRNYPKSSFDSLGPGRVLYADRWNQIWVGGKVGVRKLVGDRFVPQFEEDLKGNIIYAVLENAEGLWIGGNRGAIRVAPDGRIRHYGARDGLPSDFVLAMREDRAGNLWFGTSVGVSRFQGGRFTNFPADNKEEHDLVWALYEDREGDVWIGSNSSLTRLRDDLFTTYGKPEGLPGDEPFVARQDKGGKIWLGYHDSGLVQFDGRRSYKTVDGLADKEVFNIREGQNGELLLCTRRGLDILRDGRLSHLKLPAPETPAVFDAMVDRHGMLWAVNSAGAFRFEGGRWRNMAEGGTIAVIETPDGSIWSGLVHDGLWRIAPGKTLFTPKDGLGSNEIRALYAEPDGTLWIGTFGGGLNRFKDGRFRSFTAHDGLLSDNIAHIEDDGNGYLWLSTTRGVCRIAKQQLRDLADGKIRQLKPDNYGIADGLRSAQVSPAVPASGGGTRTADGRLWFTTGGGVAVIDSHSVKENWPKIAPLINLSEVIVDGHRARAAPFQEFQPGTRHVQFRFTGIYLRSPERVRYTYKLEGLDSDWNASDERRTVSYNPLSPGAYNFRVRAMLPEGGSTETQFSFAVRPHLYQSRWFFLLCGLSAVGALYAVYYFRLKRVQSRLALVSQERTRMAREIHDTLAQGLIGISHQLDASVMTLREDVDLAEQHLELARKMARHSLTEARRSVFDLRCSELEKKDLPDTLHTSAPGWAAGSRVEVKVETTKISPALSADVEQHLLRIAQEAVANAVRHAKATVILVQLEVSDGSLKLRVRDDGQGFQPPKNHSLVAGHFGIVGMQERAERLGGVFELESNPGSGTLVEVSIPLA